MHPTEGFLGLKLGSGKSAGLHNQPQTLLWVCGLPSQLLSAQPFIFLLLYTGSLCPLFHLYAALMTSPEWWLMF